MNTLKKWVFDRFFKSESTSLYEYAKRQGSIDAFAKAHADIRETMVEDIEKKASVLANKRLEEMFTLVDERLVATFDEKTGTAYIGGEKAHPQTLNNLRSEAEFILGSEVWKLMYETPKKLAHKEMFVAGENIDAVKKGRSMIYTLESQKKLLETFKTFVPK